MRILITFALLFVPLGAIAAHSAQALDCGTVPVVTDEGLKADVRGRAQLLSRFIGNADLIGKINTAQTDIFRDYPEADKSRTNAFFLHVMCDSISNDASLSEKEKREELIRVRREILGSNIEQRNFQFSTVSAEVCSKDGYNAMDYACLDIPKGYRFDNLTVEDLKLRVKPGYTNDWCSHRHGCDGNVTCAKQQSIPMNQVAWSAPCDSEMFAASDHRICIYVRARPTVSLSEGGSTHCIGRTLKVTYYR